MAWQSEVGRVISDQWCCTSVLFPSKYHLGYLLRSGCGSGQLWSSRYKTFSERFKQRWVLCVLQNAKK